ncbi:MAG: alpha/beta hydrolase [Xanthobacteraceae bacterium]
MSKTATPRPHVEGPLVWLDMDQQALDDAYDQTFYAPNREQVRARRAANNAIALKIIGKPQRVAYGAAEIERVDIYKTKRPNAPVMIFLHGGAWRGGTSSQAASMAENFINAGAHFVPVDFNNVIETGGDLFPMVDQVRRAVAWVYRNARSFGGDPGRLYLTGHSSGGHLGSCAVMTEWHELGLPRDLLKGALLGSGMYDLKAVRLSKRSAYVKFTDAMEQALSAQRHIDKIHTPLVITYGSLETPEFQRQARDFHAALTAAGKPAKLLLGEAYNHFETQETLGSPYGFMGRAALEMMGISR